MPTTHTVVQGDCLANVARDYGFGDWHTIYDDPRNADLKAKRPNPNVLYPGDQLYIPDITQRDESCQTDLNHRFQLLAQPTYLNLCIKDPSGKPISGAKYILILEDAPGETEKLTLHGKTDGGGWIKHKISPVSEYGTLQVWPNPADHEIFFKWHIKLGHLDPLETTSGVKARLNNLGYDCGDPNSMDDDLYHQMVRQFQRDHELQEDGIVGPQTRDKLNQEHCV
jgi:hypothetical protein